MTVSQRYALAETQGFRRRGDAGRTAPDHHQVVNFQIVRHSDSLLVHGIFNISGKSISRPDQILIHFMPDNIASLSTTIFT
jgi:hypothetical protein